MPPCYGYPEELRYFSDRPIEGAVDNEVLGENVHLALRVLTPKERRIIVLNPGLGGEVPMTLIKVAERVGMEVTKVRQLLGVQCCCRWYL